MKDSVLIEQSESYDLSMIVLVISMAVFAFSFGRFAFFDILGVKTLVQIALLLMSISGLLLVKDRVMLEADIYTLFLLSMMIFEFVIRGDLVNSIGWMLALYFKTIIFSLPPFYVSFAAEVIVVLAFCFATMMILQFWLLMVIPDLAQHTFLMYQDYSQGNQVLVSHPITLLGLGVPNVREFFGLEIFRLRSFASEPSRLICYFLLPAVIGFTQGAKRYKLASLVILTAATLSFSGTVQLTLIIGVALLLIHKLFDTSRLMLVGFFGCGVLFIGILEFLGYERVMAIITLIEIYNSELGLGDFVRNSALVRTQLTFEALESAKTSFLIGDTSSLYSAPLLIHLINAAGLTGLVFGTAMIISILKTTVDYVSIDPVGGIMFYALLLQSTVLKSSSYLFSTTGFIFIFVIIRMMRLKMVNTREVAHFYSSPA